MMSSAAICLLPAMPDCFRGRGFGSGMGSCGLAVLKGAQLTLQGQILVIVTTEEEEDCGGVSMKQRQRVMSWLTKPKSSERCCSHFCFVSGDHEADDVVKRDMTILLCVVFSSVKY